MFNWTISLTDRQILMLLGFAAAEDDKDGSRFHAVHSMIADAWDTRAARRLIEDGLLFTHEVRDIERSAYPITVWNITRKGELIAEAIKEDTSSLQQIKLRTGKVNREIVNAVDLDIYRKKRNKKTQSKP